MSVPEEHAKQARPQGLDPVPEAVVKRAREAFSERTGGHVAELVSDSLLEGADPAEAHTLTFEGAGARIEIDIAVSEALSVLNGTIDQTSVGRAILHLEGSDLAVVTPVTVGKFSFGNVAHGVVRLSFETMGESSVSTEWFRV